jgi:hypothetical protein
MVFSYPYLFSPALLAKGTIQKVTDKTKNTRGTSLQSINNKDAITFLLSLYSLILSIVSCSDSIHSVPLISSLKDFQTSVILRTLSSSKHLSKCHRKKPLYAYVGRAGAPNFDFSHYEIRSSFFTYKTSSMANDYGTHQ